VSRSAIQATMPRRRIDRLQLRRQWRRIVGSSGPLVAPCRSRGQLAAILQQILNPTAGLGAIVTAGGQRQPMLWADAKCEFISEQRPFISSVGTFVTFTNPPLASYVFFRPRGIFRVFCRDQTQKSMHRTVASMQQRTGECLRDSALKHRWAWKGIAMSDRNETTAFDVADVDIGSVGRRSFERPIATFSIGEFFGAAVEYAAKL